MPPFISLTNLSWTAPDGDPVLTDITLHFALEHTGIVGRNGTGKTTLLRLIAGDLKPASGQVSLSGTLAWMPQDLLARPDDTIADLLGVRPALDLLRSVELGEAGADALAEPDWLLPARVEAVLARCGLAADPGTPLRALSGGQRSRAALAASIFPEPDFLLLDEPTNNLDQAGRDALSDILRTWPGGTLIVSHDRDLLDSMDAIVEMTSLGAARYGGNYTAFRSFKDNELQAAEHDLAQAQRAVGEAARRAQQQAEKKARRDGAGQRGRAKGGQPKILMDAKKGRAEASGGANRRLRDARREMAEEQVAAAREKVEILRPIRMEIQTTGLSPGRSVLVVDGLTGGYSTVQPVIRNLSFTMSGRERVVIKGPNGSGKTTLLRILAGQMRPQAGQARVMVPFALLDQHLGLLACEDSLRENFLRINPGSDANSVHATLARFGFRGHEASSRVADLSGGEQLRAGLACTLGANPPPMLLILDEPTNHLDLDGIAALEAALKDYDGAILAVSHDEAFLRSLAPDRMIELGADRDL